MQNRRSEDGCEDAVERESETGKSAITITDAERPRRPYGMRCRAHRQALSHRAMDARPAHYAKAHNASEDAYADHYRRRERRDAAERACHLHGDRCGYRL